MMMEHSEAFRIGRQTTANVSRIVYSPTVD